jgi:hypothetical protein
MRQRLVPGALLAAALAACGGSSSETPPPLQPDPLGFHYAPPPPPSPMVVEEGDAGVLPLSKALDDDERPRAPARSTWGAAPPKH